MRARSARFAALTGAAALVITGTLGIAPTATANAEPEPQGTVNVTIVDDLGKPVNGIVMLVPEGVEEDEGPEPIYLGIDDDEAAAKSSYSEDDIPAGKYGIVTMGGWPLMTCAGIKSCSLLSGGSLELTETGAFTVADGGVVNYKVTTATPKLTGTGKVGAPLFVDTPPLLNGEFSALLGGLGEMSALFGDMTEPSVTWKRNGVAIRKAEGTEYVPTGSDAGSSITAEVKFPAIFGLLASSGESVGPFGAEGVVPAPVTLGPVAVTKNDSTTDVKIVGKRRVGKAPAVWVTVNGGADRLNGWVTVTGADNKPLRLRLRDGFAKVVLKKVRAGKHKIKATFAGNSTLNASSDTVKFKIKKAKKHGKKHGKKR